MKIIRENSSSDLTEVIEVVSAEYAGNHILHVHFSDGKSTLVDFKPFLNRSIHPSITKFRDEQLFKEFGIVNGNLNWNDYDLIFPLHELHEGNIS